MAYAFAAAHRDSIRRLAIVESPQIDESLYQFPSVTPAGPGFWNFGFFMLDNGLPERIVSGREDTWIAGFVDSLEVVKGAVNPDTVAEYAAPLRRPGHLGASYASFFTHPRLADAAEGAKALRDDVDTPVVSAAASRWSVPSERSRLVAGEKPVGMLQIRLAGVRHGKSGHLVHDRVRPGLGHRSHRTDTGSSPSITAPSAPSRSSKPSLAGLVVVAVTWWPRATSCGTSRRPKTPVPPATNTRITITVLMPELTLNPETRQSRPSVTFGGKTVGEDRWRLLAVRSLRQGLVS